MTISNDYEKWMIYTRAIEERHSIRKYKDKPIAEETAASLNGWIKLLNEESGLHMQLITNEPKAFSALLSKVLHFSNANNYVALVGNASDEKLEEKCGYYGEKLVLEAQLLGLNTCWVGGTYKKLPELIDIRDGEKLVLIIAIGYGDEPGRVHKCKPHDTFYKYEPLPDHAAEDMYKELKTAPDWIKEGIKAAALGPTAINQQKFKFIYNGYTVRGEAGSGAFTKIDLGIAKYHFEIGSGRKVED